MKNNYTEVGGLLHGGEEQISPCHVTVKTEFCCYQKMWCNVFYKGEAVQADFTLVTIAFGLVLEIYIDLLLF